MAHCSVQKCCNSWHKKQYSISFHQFPKDSACRKRWVVAIRPEEGTNFKVTDRTYVCSQHFLETDFSNTMTGVRKLHKGVIPSQFSWTLKKMKRTPPKNRHRAHITKA